MTLTPAPFFDDIADTTPKGAAVWMTASDGVRIRVGHWRPEGARGTVLMFPGRTEYIEKYADTAQDLARHGFAMLAIDWRGQGLADRLLNDRRIGHVNDMLDFQKDVAAALDAARMLDLPQPWHLVGHSMGGCIGLRALMQGLPVQSCAFTGPMWGIYMNAIVQPFAWAVTAIGPALGMGNHLVPSAKMEHYVSVESFEGNVLTKDRDMFKQMQDHLIAHPDLSLGGPSLNWLGQSIRETAALAEMPSPDLPCLTFLGTDERIVDCPRVHQRMEKWPRGTLEMVQDAEHEVLMETPDIRKYTIDRMVDHFTNSQPG